MSRPRRSRGFTLIEIVISMAIVSVMLVSVLGTVGASQAMQFKGAQQSEALLLAEDLMAEILRMPYEELDQTPNMGLETGEDVGSRWNWDDVDDYNGWSPGSPPRYKQNQPITWADGYEREAKVWWIEPDNLNLPSASETGIKGVEVKVKCGGKTVLSLIGIRSSSVVKPMDPGGEDDD